MMARPARPGGPPSVRDQRASTRADRPPGTRPPGGPAAQAAGGPHPRRSPDTRPRPPGRQRRRSHVPYPRRSLAGSLEQPRAHLARLGEHHLHPIQAPPTYSRNRPRGCWERRNGGPRLCQARSPAVTARRRRVFARPSRIPEQAFGCADERHVYRKPTRGNPGSITAPRLEVRHQFMILRGCPPPSDRHAGTSTTRGSRFYCASGRWRRGGQGGRRRSRSALDWHARQRAASGRASSRPSGTGRPHSVQMP